MLTVSVDLQTEWAGELGDDLLSAVSNLGFNLFNSISSMVTSFGSIFTMFGTSGGWLTKNLLLPLLFPTMTTRLVETFRPGSIEEAERKGTFNRATYPMTIMSNYWGETGPSPEFWNDVIETLLKIVNEISSQPDQEQETDTSLLRNYNTMDGKFKMSVYGGNGNSDYTWLHYKFQRTSMNKGFWVVEHNIVYFIGNKRYTETQYWVMLPDPLGKLCEGNSHTFKYKLYNMQGGYVDHTTTYYEFYKKN